MTARAWELIGVPYTSAREPGGIANAISALRAAGLAERLGPAGVRDGGDLELIPPSGERARSGLLNESALLALVEKSRACVGDFADSQRLPLLVGGDCPVVLGPLVGIRDRGERPGLVMLDGHEDAWPPGASPTGEASDSEIAIALGEVALLREDLDALMPVLDPGALAQLGPRDAAEIAAAGLATLRDRAAYFIAGADLHEGDVERSMRAALAALSADALWVHIDLDVLSTTAMAAVDYRQEGGINWDELDRLAAEAISDPRCRGVSVAIYNPTLDPDRRDARRVIDFLERLGS